MGNIFATYFLLICLFSFFCPQTLKAGEAAIADLVVANSKTDLLAFFTIENAFSPELIEGVQHGIPVTFTFEIELDVNRARWFDKSLVSGSFEHTLTYDNLKKVYSVRLNEHREEVRLTDDLRRAQRWMSEANGIHVISLAEMIPDHNYTLRVKATLEKTTLPLKFHYLIPFSQFWDLQTDWTEVEFLY